MKYTNRYLILLILLLSSLCGYSTTGDNIYTRKTTTAASRWSPVSSDINVSYSRNSYNVGMTNRRYYYSGGGNANVSYSNRSFSTNRGINNSSIRFNSIAPRSINRNKFFNTMENTSLFSGSGNEFFADNGMESGFDNDSRPTQQRARGQAHPDEIANGAANPGGDNAPALPLTDAVPCLVIMILAVAVIKYRKLH